MFYMMLLSCRCRVPGLAAAVLGPGWGLASSDRANGGEARSCSSAEKARGPSACMQARRKVILFFLASLSCFSSKGGLFRGRVCSQPEARASLLLIVFFSS